MHFVGFVDSDDVNVRSGKVKYTSLVGYAGSNHLILAEDRASFRLFREAYRKGTSPMPIWRWSHKPCSDLWAVLGKETVLDKGHILHGDAVLGCNLRCWCSEGFKKGLYETQGGGANVVAPGYTKGAGLGAEIIGTFVLVYTVFSATDAKRNARDSHVPKGKQEMEGKSVDLCWRNVAADLLKPDMDEEFHSFLIEAAKVTNV